jgi:hypothetical protein
VREAVLETPPKLAVIVTACSSVMEEAAVAEKVAEVAPAVTVTEAGTVRAVLLSDT